MHFIRNFIFLLLGIFPALLSGQYATQDYDGKWVVGGHPVVHIVEASWRPNAWYMTELNNLMDHDRINVPAEVV